MIKSNIAKHTVCSGMLIRSSSSVKSGYFARDNGDNNVLTHCGSEPLLLRIYHVGMHDRSGAGVGRRRKKKQDDKESYCPIMHFVLVLHNFPTASTPIMQRTTHDHTARLTLCLTIADKLLELSAFQDSCEPLEVVEAIFV
jgi:hypothetical protein